MVKEFMGTIIDNAAASMLSIENKREAATLPTTKVGLLELLNSLITAVENNKIVEDTIRNSHDLRLKLQAYNKSVAAIKAVASAVEEPKPADPVSENANMGTYYSVEKAFLKEGEVACKMMLVGGDKIISGDVVEIVEEYRPDDGNAGYDILKVTAASLGDIIKQTCDGVTYRAFDITDDFIDAWEPISLLQQPDVYTATSNGRDIIYHLKDLQGQWYWQDPTEYRWHLASGDTQANFTKDCSKLTRVLDGSTKDFIIEGWQEAKASYLEGGTNV